MDANAIGEELYALVAPCYPELAGKLVGMLLQLGLEECAACLEEQERLAGRLDDAMRILDSAGGIAAAPAKPKAKAKAKAAAAAAAAKGGAEEERRVDPEDGAARTFGELQQLCAGQYSQAEIEDYWNAMAPAQPPAGAPAAEAPAATNLAPPAQSSAPAAAPAAVADASAQEGEGDGEVIEGLSAWLQELRLAQYTALAAAWIEEQGACNLEEVVENLEDFADALPLKPLERNRLVKGGAAAVEPALAAPRRPPPAAPAAAPAPAPAPAPVPAPAPARGAPTRGATPAASAQGAAEARDARERAREDAEAQAAEEEAVRIAAEAEEARRAMADELAEIDDEMSNLRTRETRSTAKQAAKAKPKAAPAVHVAHRPKPVISREEAEWQRESERQEAEFRRKQQARQAERDAETAAQAAEEKKEQRAREAAARQEQAAAELAAKVSATAGAAEPAEDFPALGAGDWQAAAAGKKGRKKRV